MVFEGHAVKRIGLLEVLHRLVGQVWHQQFLLEARLVHGDWTPLDASHEAHVNRLRGVHDDRLVDGSDFTPRRMVVSEHVRLLHARKVVDQRHLVSHLEISDLAFLFRHIGVCLVHKLEMEVFGFWLLSTSHLLLRLELVQRLFRFLRPIYLLAQRLDNEALVVLIRVAFVIFFVLFDFDGLQRVTARIVVAHISADNFNLASVLVLALDLLAPLHTHVVHNALQLANDAPVLQLLDFHGSHSLFSVQPVLHDCPLFEEVVVLFLGVSF